MDCKYCPLMDKGACSEGLSIEDGKCPEGLVTRIQRAVFILSNNPTAAVKENAAVALKESLKEFLILLGAQYYPVLERTTFKAKRWEPISASVTKEDQEILKEIDKAIDMFGGIYTKTKDIEF